MILQLVMSENNDGNNDRKRLVYLQTSRFYAILLMFLWRNVTIQNPIRKTALSELSFCSCGCFAKEIFKIMLIHASMIRKFVKIALALNSYGEIINK